MDVSVISPFQCKMTAVDEKCSSERVRQYSLMKKSFAQQTQVTRQVVFEYSLLACEFFFYSLAIQGCPCSLYCKKKKTGRILAALLFVGYGCYLSISDERSFTYDDYFSILIAVAKQKTMLVVILLVASLLR